MFAMTCDRTGIADACWGVGIGCGLRGRAASQAGVEILAQRTKWLCAVIESLIDITMYDM